MGFIGLKCNEISLSLFCTVPPYTHQQRYMNEDEIDPNTDNFMIFAILYFFLWKGKRKSSIENNFIYTTEQYQQLRE